MTPREQARRSRQIIGQDFPPFLETIRDMDLPVEDKAMILESFLELLEPLARSGHEYLKRCRHGQEMAIRSREESPNKQRVLEAAKTLWREGEYRRGMARKIQERFSIPLSVRQINKYLQSRT